MSAKKILRKTRVRSAQKRSGKKKKKPKKKTIRPKRKRSTAASRPPPDPEKVRRLSRTMPIPVEHVLDDLSLNETAYLDIHCPGRDVMRILLDGNELTIGRGRSCEISLPLENVSSKHARIIWHLEECLIEDLESTNGTYVNNVRISRCVLHDNDQIRIGAARLLFLHQRIRGAV